MGDGLRAGLFRVVNEIALRVELGIIADDLDGVLVGATVPSAPRPKNIARNTSSPSVLNRGSYSRLVWETSSLMPIVKVVLRLVLLQLVEHGLDHRRRENSFDDKP
jgi:hypothetical protein